MAAPAAWTPELAAARGHFLSAGGAAAAGPGLMEAFGPKDYGGEDAALRAEGRLALEAGVHFRVTRFIMEAGNRHWEEGGPRAAGTWRPGLRSCTFAEPICVVGTGWEEGRGRA